MTIQGVLLILTLTTAMSCSDAKLHSAELKSGTSSTSRAASEGSGNIEQNEGQTPGDTQASVAEPGNASDPVPTLAIQPIAIGGAYLICMQTTEVNCRIDSDTTRNISVAAGFNLQFYYQGTPVDFKDATLKEWAWTLAVDTLLKGRLEVKLKIMKQDLVDRELLSLIESGSLLIGDGFRTVQTGCIQPADRVTRSTGVEMIQPFTSDGKSIVIDLQGICGIVRPDETYLQVVNDQNKEILKAFLPVTSGAVDRHFNLIDLPAGTYTLKLHSGDIGVIDDFYVTNLSINTIVQ